MPEPFAFDSIGFLQLLNQLERRFDEVVSHAPLSFDRIDSPTIQPHTSTESSNRRTGAFHRRGSAAKGRNATPERAENEQMCQTVSAQVQAQMDLFSRVDRRIDVLAQDLFGPTHWGSLIRMASLGLDHDLIDEARKFMLYCSSTVRRHGMAVWLYDIMNDASMALLLHKPAEHMPVIVNGPDVVNGRLRCGLDATVQMNWANVATRMLQPRPFPPHLHVGSVLRGEMGRTGGEAARTGDVDTQRLGVGHVHAT